ncbi:MAG: flagellar hook-associated protein FlgK, partial [Rhodospirillales bacterium]|nr:flagellar hook-associated protein FlgK [Rhodospirillales bacterium]
MSGNLTLALRTAQSGLLVNQAGLEVTANNVSNVSTEGYSRKIANVQSRVIDGNGAGVELGRISRSVDEGLLKSLRTELSTLSSLEIKDQYFGLLEDTFGTISDNSSISHILEEFGIALEALAVSPEKFLEQSEVARWATETSYTLDEMSGAIQDLRLQADRAIADNVTEADKLVSSIGELNDKIVRNLAVGNNVTDLQDQRDKAIDDLSKIIDVSYYTRSSGDIIVFTTGGTTLVDNVAATLSHDAASAAGPTVTFAEGDFSNITVTLGNSNFDITNDIRDGSLKALIDMRDDILTNLQSQLDELAGALRDTLNQIHNRGSAYPGLQSMTGSRNFALSASQTISLDPTNSVDDVTIALLNTTGDQQAATTLNTIMTSAIYGSGAQTSHGAWSINEVAATLQDWLQANGAASASVSINSDDKFSIELNNTSLNLSFRDETATANGSIHEDAEIKFDADGDGTVDETISGFSNFFGLNDFFVDSLFDDIHESDVVAGTFTTSAGTLRFTDDTGLIGTVAVAAGTSLTDLASDISAISGITAKVIPDGSGYR